MIRRLIGSLVVVVAALAASLVLFLTPQWAAGSSPRPEAAAEQTIRAVFGSGSPRAIRIARCESHLDRRAVSPYGDHGLFQIHGATWFGQVVSWYKTRPHVWIRVKARRILEPRYNSLVAFAISRGGTSWGPWTCSRLVG